MSHDLTAHPSHIQLLGGFELTVDETVVRVGRPSQKVLAFVTLARRRCSRLSVCSALWPDIDERRAFANLRCAIWKLGPLAGVLLDVDHESVGLRKDVMTDISAFAQRVADSPANLERYLAIGSTDALLRLDLLPDWFDDWVLFERERIGQQRLHLLEVVSVELSRQGRHREAIDAALLAVQADPLRESAHHVLIDAHLHEGNIGLAAAQLQRYERILFEEFNLSSAPKLRERIAAACAHGDIVIARLERRPSTRRCPLGAY
jgi:DNA-binding SARP family transcriptional activator